MGEGVKAWRVVAVRRLSNVQLAELSAVAEVEYFEEITEHNRANFLATLLHAHGLIGGKLELDEPALIEALQRGVIRAAGLDVFTEEPLLADSPLASMDNVVATPHIDSATHETREAMAQLAVDNLIGELSGDGPLSPVNEVTWRKPSVASEGTR